MSWNIQERQPDVGEEMQDTESGSTAPPRRGLFLDPYVVTQNPYLPYVGDVMRIE